MIYIIIILLLLYGISQYDAKDKSGSDKYYLFIWLVFTLVAGLSYRLGVDVIRYEDSFGYYSGSLRLSDLLDYEGYSGSEPLWQLLNWIVYHTFGEFWVLKLAISVFVNSVIFWFIKKHSELPFTCVLFYFIFLFFQLNFQILRESIAIAVWLIALDGLINDKKIIRYILLVAVASLFHRFAFVAVLFPLIMYFKNDWKFVLLVAVLLVVTPFLSELFSSMFSMDLFAIGLNSRLEGLIDDETYGITSRNIFGYIEMMLFHIVPVILIIGNSRQDKFQALGLGYVVLTILRMSVFVILYRLTNYLFFPFAIALTSSLNNGLKYNDFSMQKLSFMRSKKMTLVILLLYIAVYIKGFVFSDNFVMYYPYSSIITKTVDSAREAFMMRIL